MVGYKVMEPQTNKLYKNKKNSEMHLNFLKIEKKNIFLLPTNNLVVCRSTIDESVYALFVGFLFICWISRNKHIEPKTIQHKIG